MATTSEEYQGSSARVDHSNDGIVLVPPQLPPFLATLFNLRPISGVPSIEEVKLVHDAIRGLNNLLQTPELRDSNLPVELSQHLFDIQMVCYRDRHPVGIFPNDIMYTPPTLPAHIPISLEPIIGPPSDGELRSALAALRISDSFANVASVFDENLNMQLSQHAFDLQLARHIQRSSRDQSPRSRPEPQNRNSARTGAQLSGSVHSPGDMHVSGEPEGTSSPGGVTSGPEPGPTRASSGVPPDEPTTTCGNERRAELPESTTVLVEIRETLKDVIRVLVASQNSLARGFNSSRKASGEGYSFGAHSLINDKGEMPEMQGLPTIRSGSWFYETSKYIKEMTPTLLAQYFQFYGIGSELIEEGIEPSIKAGKEEDARKLLARRLYVVSPSPPVP